MSVILRELESNDAPKMLDWMHDNRINKWYKFPFGEMTLEKAKGFIDSAKEDEKTKHFAVSDEFGEYIGTISLKNIDNDNQCAEMAIVLRYEYHGSGIATEAAYKLFDIAFNKYLLHKVYLNVLSDNARAIHFYKKIGFVEEGVSKDAVKIGGIFRDLTWFGILREEYDSHMEFYN